MLLLSGLLAAPVVLVIGVSVGTVEADGDRPVVAVLQELMFQASVAVLSVIVLSVLALASVVYEGSWHR